MKTDHLGTTAQGQAGVHRVMSELILRGHVPWTPAYDSAGVDLIVDGSVRLQVKTTMRALPERKYNGRTWVAGALVFSVGHTHYEKGRLKTIPRVFSKQCDLVVLWAIEPNRFWIVPAHILDGRHSFSIAPNQRVLEFDTEKAMNLRKQGWTFRAIGELLGVPEHTIKRRLYRSPDDMNIKRSMPSMEFRKCEGRWDLIAEYVNLSREANRLVTTPAVADINREAFLKA